MIWWPWNHPNLRRDPERAHAGPPSRSLFAPLPRHRPMIVMVDDLLRQGAARNPIVQYLLELLAAEPIEALLYSDAGLSTATPRAKDPDSGVEAAIGRVEIGPG